MSAGVWYSRPQVRELPSIGLAGAGVGGLLVVLGFTTLDWADGASFRDVRRAVDLGGSSFTDFTQFYMLFLYLPLIILTLGIGVCVTLGPVPARIATTVAGVVGGLGLLGLVLFVVSGGVGTEDSRDDATPALVTIALLGVFALVAGIGSFFEQRAYMSRALAAVVAATAAVIHLIALGDVFHGPAESSAGAWLPAIGYVLVAAGAVLPYRRVARPPPATVPVRRG